MLLLAVGFANTSSGVDSIDGRSYMASVPGTLSSIELLLLRIFLSNMIPRLYFDFARQNIIHCLLVEIKFGFLLGSKLKYFGNELYQKEYRCVDLYI